MSQRRSSTSVTRRSSLITFLENTSAWRKEFREREYGSLDEDREFLAEASPLTHIDNIKAPLFIIHGRNDPRVPVGEAEQIHDVLRSKGITSDLLIYENEGAWTAEIEEPPRRLPQSSGLPRMSPLEGLTEQEPVGPGSGHND